MRMTRKRQLEKELREQTTLLRQWCRWHAAQCDEALAGPAGELVAQLLAILDNMTIKSGAELLAFIRSQNWNVDTRTRDACLFAIGTRLVVLRERAALVPFDDGLDREPSTLFLIIKATIREGAGPNSGK
jgi:hypothetical protein